MSILKGNQSDDLTLKYLIEKNKGGGGGDTPDIPEPATEMPVMDGTAAVGTSEKYAREDHAHPTDTSRASVADVNGKVSKSGDSMSGQLTVSYYNNPKIVVKSPLIDSATNPSLSEERNAGLRIRDKNDREIGYVQAVQNTAGRISLDVVARRYYNGANLNHGIRFRIAADGTRTCLIDDPDSVKTALGLGSVTSSYPSVSDVATAASGFSVTSVAVCTWGKVIQLGITVERTGSAISADTTITVATLKSAYRPVIYTSMMCANAQFYHATIQTGGDISVRVSGWSKNATKTFRTTYLLP